MHFAAHTIVPESVSNPLKYYGNNTCSTRNLLQCCQEAGVKHFVFSSTAAVYGIPAGGVAAEDTPTAADQSVRHVEADERVDAARPRRRDAHCATSCCAISTSRAAIPADASGSRRSTRTLLTKVACEAAVGKRPHVSIFGTDYPTPRRHRRARLHPRRGPRRRAPQGARLPARQGGASATLNCGYGHGYSVREVISMVDRAQRPAAARPSKSRAAPAIRRRWWPGPQRVREVLGWSPRHDDLEAIVRSQLEWERRLQQEPQLQKN